MKITIQPETTGSVPLQMEYHSFKQTEADALLAAVWRFAETLGLVTCGAQALADPSGQVYVEFMLGTGCRFVAFKSLEG